MSFGKDTSVKLKKASTRSWYLRGCSCIAYKNSMFVTKTSRSTFGKCWLPWFIWARCGTFRYVVSRVQVVSDAMRCLPTVFPLAKRCMASYLCGFGRLDPWRNHFDYWIFWTMKKTCINIKIKTRFFDMFWMNRNFKTVSCGKGTLCSPGLSPPPKKRRVTLGSLVEYGLPEGHLPSLDASNKSCELWVFQNSECHV